MMLILISSHEGKSITTNLYRTEPIEDTSPGALLACHPERLVVSLNDLPVTLSAAKGLVDSSVALLLQNDTALA